jgi:hypothetical protein
MRAMDSLREGTGDPWRLSKSLTCDPIRLGVRYIRYACYCFQAYVEHVDAVALRAPDLDLSVESDQRKDVRILVGWLDQARRS